MTHAEPLPFAHGGPVCAAQFKALPSDFLVSEILPFAADGEGHHWLLEVEKNNLNTLELLDTLSRQFRVPRRQLGYSGLKDRHAITRQFITLPKASFSEEALLANTSEQWRVLSVVPHRRKLRVGSHRQNAFEITLRNIPNEANLRERIGHVANCIQQLGVPNYFGPQRFGNDGANLRKARQLFTDGRTLPRQQHRFAVSAARSALFNAVLAQRVQEGSWNELIQGEAVSLDGSSSWFAYSKLDDRSADRLRAFDIHPSGPMWGAGELPVTEYAAQLEAGVVQQHKTFTDGLEKLGLKQERRALRQKVDRFEWDVDGSELRLKFVLPKGGFATSVLRELVTADELVLTGMLSDIATGNEITSTNGSP